MWKINGCMILLAAALFAAEVAPLRDELADQLADEVVLLWGDLITEDISARIKRYPGTFQAAEQFRAKHNLSREEVTATMIAWAKVGFQPEDNSKLPGFPNASVNIASPLASVAIQYLEKCPPTPEIVDLFRRLALDSPSSWYRCRAAGPYMRLCDTSALKTFLNQVLTGKHAIDFLENVSLISTYQKMSPESQQILSQVLLEALAQNPGLEHTRYLDVNLMDIKYPGYSTSEIHYQALNRMQTLFEQRLNGAPIEKGSMAEYTFRSITNQLETVRRLRKQQSSLPIQTLNNDSNPKPTASQ